MWPREWIYEYYVDWAGLWPGKLKEFIESKGLRVINNGIGWVQVEDGTKYKSNYFMEKEP